ncbi:rCG63707 [Rattus norvegicus]|uniref:RCG63707 n=1 Tax=Rattus norvegicus TaxID=10116 RepID=A6IGV5_RAT|nr:rCG63707 [Rattus norvegicus]
MPMELQLPRATLGSYQEHTHLTYTHHYTATCLAMNITSLSPLLLPKPGVSRLKRNIPQQQNSGHHECLTEH